MPKPTPGESRQDFLDRCIPMLIDEGRGRDQAVAACNSMFEEKSTSVFVKSIDDEKAVVAGWGVIFGGKDLEGDTFTKATDFMLDLVPSKLVMYDHGLNKEVKTSFLGFTQQTAVKDFGVWVEAELERSRAYVDEVLKLVEKGVIGWSSGSVGHLVEMQGHQIKRWPIVEFSLTPTPAEPRTLGVERIKTLAKDFPNLKSLLESADAANVHETGQEQASYTQLQARAMLLISE